jgi:hypothetical protein
MGEGVFNTFVPGGFPVHILQVRLPSYFLELLVTKLEFPQFSKLSLAVVESLVNCRRLL